MSFLLGGLASVGIIPLALTFWTKRRTSLAHAVVWAMGAWFTWAAAIFAEAPALRYGALCLTGCAGVAVLGARRPHVVAWNFVILGLLAVMLLPLAEEWLIGTRSMDGLRVLFLGATLAVGTLNYLPTRVGPASVLLLLVCETQILAQPVPWVTACLDGALAVVPWLAWICWRSRKSELSEIDQVWLDFRDSWGMVWSQRVREQFNNAAQNAGWPIKLGWQRLMDSESSAPGDKYLETLRAILMRFRAPD